MGALINGFLASALKTFAAVPMGVVLFFSFGGAFYACYSTSFIFSISIYLSLSSIDIVRD